MKLNQKSSKTARRSLAILLLAGTALLCAGFTLHTITETVADVDVAGESNYKSFNWKWSGYNDEKFVVNWPYSPTKVALQLSYPRNGTVFLTMVEGTNSTDIVTTAAQSVGTVLRTNLPPSGTYYAEFLDYETTTNAVNTRIIAKGKIKIIHSVFENTTQSTWVNPLAGTQIGPPLHTLTSSANWPFATTLIGLTDVNTNAPTSGQILGIDASGNWTNTTAGVGNGDVESVTVGTNNTLTVASSGGPDPVISLSTNTIRLATAAQATNAYTWAVADAGGGSGDLTAVQVGTNNTLTVASGTGPVPVISLSTNTIRLATAAQATNAYTWAVADAGGGTTNANLIGMERIAGSTYSTVEDLQTIFHSPGYTSGGLITDAGGSTVDVAAGSGLIRGTNSNVAIIQWMDWPASAGFATTNNTVRYFGVEYNAGTPQVVAKSSYSWNLQTEFPIGNVVNEANILSIENAPYAVGDHAGLMLRRSYETMPLQRDQRTGGLILGEAGTRNVTLTAGVLWERLQRFTIGALDTSVSDVFSSYYRDGAGGWTISTNATQWGNTQYDDGTGSLQTMTNNRYANHWAYLTLGGKLILLYPQAEHSNQANAEAEGAPSIVPDIVTTQSKLIGRIIFQKSGATASSIETVFGTTFAGSAATDHGNLAGLSDDDHTQYLQDAEIDTSAEIAAIVTDETGTGALVLAGNPTLSNDLIFDEQADHSSTPGAAKGYLWTKSTVPSTLIFTDDTGADTTLGAGGGAAGGIVWISAADFMAFDTGATDEWGHLFHELDSSTHSVEGTGIHTLSTTTQQGRLKASFATPKGSTAWSTTDAIRLRYWGDAASTDNQILEVNFYGRNGTNDFAWIERHTPDVQPTAANNMEEIAWDLADIGTNTIYETYTVEILQSTRSSSAIWISGIALEFE